MDNADGTTTNRFGNDTYLAMNQTSIRNRLNGTIREIVSDQVVSEVTVDTAAGTISAVITTRSVQELKLKVGDQIDAIIKATNVSLERS